MNWFRSCGYGLICMGLVVFLSCGRDEPDPTAPLPDSRLFTSMPASYTGVDFINELEYTEAYNPYTFRNFYNGGGVALGDINNDGLLDLFFCGNLLDNKLYLNQGNFQFEEITREAGVASPGVWTAGVSMADINGDGWLDIYLCKSGDPKGENRHNELFINNGPGEDGRVTFTEQAEAWGINDLGLSTHAAFFDYDRDGDLDCYLLNNSIRSVGGYDLREGQREIRDPEGGNKLYRNDGDHFTDVSEFANIYGSNIGFGLGVTIGDVNRDGWPDIYVSNDFFERDYLYINNQDGTFEEALEQYIREISLSSMGADMADVNNDGYPEIFVTDMLPEGEERMKTKTAFENWDKYQLNLKSGYYRQFTRNVLQLNNQDSTFSEIGRMAGVYATDWSWGALIVDLNNDGRKDIFVANGIYKDLTDQDYINFYSDPETVRAIMRREKGVITKLIDAIPSQAVGNYAFRNDGNLEFINVAEEWGLDEPSFSNGSAYGDLDNDGDLDLVTNNVNMRPFLMRNNADTLLDGRANYLTVQLKGAGKNPYAIGAHVTIRQDGQTYFQELFPMRGFQSTVDHRLHFGLGSAGKIDSMIVGWPGGRYTLLTEVAANQMLTLRQEDADWSVNPFSQPKKQPRIFHPAGDRLGIDYRHRENEFSDFNRDRLLYHMKSSEGPCLALGDVNGDGRDDFYIGGAKGSPGGLYVQQAGGGFAPTNAELLEKSKASEDTDALFFDADGDGDQDLYVCSGGNELPSSSTALIDRLYFNDGRGGFRKANQILPTSQFESSSCVDAADYDGDGDQDLFVGIRLRPGLYGVPVNGYLLENDGLGNFTDVTSANAADLQELGLITDGKWFDYDRDGDPDLVVVGEYMPVKVFRNDAGRLSDVTSETGLEGTNGWWNKIALGDLNEDGYPDLVLGNHGRNSRFQATEDQPVRMYINDFDKNGNAEQVITVYKEGTAYPLVLLHDLVKQMPGLRKKYLKYESYKGQTVSDIFSAGELERSIVLEAYQMSTSVVMNGGDGTFSLKELPVAAQMAPVYGISIKDFDRDGHQDILMAGNFFRAKPEVGSYASSYGLFLKGDGAGSFTPLPASHSGFRVKGEVRELVPLKAGKKEMVLVAKNDDEVEVFEY